MSKSMFKNENKKESAYLRGIFMEQKDKKKNIGYPVFASVICIAGFLFLCANGWGKLGILLVPVFAWNAYRIFGRKNF